MLDSVSSPPRLRLADASDARRPTEIAAGDYEIGGEQTTDGYRYLLLCRFIVLNLVGFALLATAYLHGLVDQVLAGDRTYLSVVIFGVFLCGLVICGHNVWRTSTALNRLRTRGFSMPWHGMPGLAGGTTEQDGARSAFASMIRLKLSHRIGIVRHIADTLVLLGLIGTVVGFIIALSGVDPDAASNVRSVTPMIATLIEGMSTALYTTLVGAVLYVWLMAGYRTLATGTVKLIAALVALGDDRGRA